MQLLREFNSLNIDPDRVRREREKTGKVTLTGVLQKADTLNQNGRIYPRAILEREIRNYQKLIAERRSVAELDHPNEAIVQLDRVSHIVTEARMEGNTVRGTIELLDTPKGEIARKLVEAGVKLGISSRGLGTTKRQGEHDIVQNDYTLVCFDLVAEPSTPSAFLMREGREVTVDELSRVFTRGDRLYRIANEIIAWKAR